MAAAARAPTAFELLGRQLDAELAGEHRPTVVVKVSAEMRALDKAVGEQVGRVHWDDDADHQAFMRG